MHINPTFPSILQNQILNKIYQGTNVKTQYFVHQYIM